MTHSCQWYIIHAVAGSENKVASELTAQFEKNGLSSLLQDVLVPKKSFTTVRRNQKVEAEERILPGYIFINMACTLEALHTIRRIPRVIGMLGSDAKGVPQPLSEMEVRRLIDHVETMKDSSSHHLTFERGEIVKVSEGLFSSMEGIVEEVDCEKSRLKISISIFGRPTPVELEFSQVEKIL